MNCIIIILSNWLNILLQIGISQTALCLWLLRFVNLLLLVFNSYHNMFHFAEIFILLIFLRWRALIFQFFITFDFFHIIVHLLVLILTMNITWQLMRIVIFFFNLFVDMPWSVQIYFFSGWLVSHRQAFHNVFLFVSGDQLRILIAMSIILCNHHWHEIKYSIGNSWLYRGIIWLFHLIVNCFNTFTWSNRWHQLLIKNGNLCLLLFIDRALNIIIIKVSRLFYILVPVSFWSSVFLTLTQRVNVRQLCFFILLLID